MIGNLNAAAKMRRCAWCGLQGSLFREELENEELEPRCRESQDSNQQSSINSRDEQLSNMLLKTEGASALVSFSFFISVEHIAVSVACKFTLLSGIPLK